MFYRGKSFTGKKTKSKGQTIILKPTNLRRSQISQLWPKKSDLATLASRVIIKIGILIHRYKVKGESAI